MADLNTVLGRSSKADANVAKAMQDQADAILRQAKAAEAMVAIDAGQESYVRREFVTLLTALIPHTNTTKDAMDIASAAQEAISIKFPPASSTV